MLHIMYIHILAMMYVIEQMTKLILECSRWGADAVNMPCSSSCNSVTTKGMCNNQIVVDYHSMRTTSWTLGAVQVAEAEVFQH